MSRLTTHLAAIETWVKGLQHGGQPLVTDCQRQLDLIDAEDVTRQSFRAPAAFLVMPRLSLINRPDGGRDAACWLAIAIVVRGTGAAADIDALDRLITLVAALDDQSFGQQRCSEPEEIEGRAVLQASTEMKGLAVVVATFRQLLYRIVEPPAATLGLAGAIGAGGPARGNPATFTRDNGLSPEEQAIVDGWPRP